MRLSGLGDGLDTWNLWMKAAIAYPDKDASTPPDVLIANGLAPDAGFLA